MVARVHLAQSEPEMRAIDRRSAHRQRALRRICSPQLMPTGQVRGAGGRGPSVERDHWQRSENPAFSLESAGPEACALCATSRARASCYINEVPDSLIQIKGVSIS